MKPICSNCASCGRITTDEDALIINGNSGIPYAEIYAHTRLIIPCVSAAGTMSPETAYAAGFRECQEKILCWLKQFENGSQI